MKTTICDVETVDGEKQVVDQKEYNVPTRIFDTPLCSNFICDSRCEICVVTKLFPAVNKE